MKKLFWIPLFVILTVIPMIAGAAPVAGEPVAGNAGSPTATNAPKYALKTAGAGDEKAALASYVKGAYNAVIKGINNTQDEINTLNTGIETYSDAIGHLTDGKATKDGTVATIKNATTTESINTSSVNITGVTTTSISATASGNVNLVVPIMDDWENDSLAETPVQTTASFTNLPVQNLKMSAPTSNTATLTKTGIIGNVDVSEYTATSAAYTRLEYLESSGEEYIDLGGNLNTKTDDIEIEVQLVQTTSATSFFGARGTTTESPYTLNAGSGYWRWGWKNNTDPTDVATDTNKHTFYVNHTAQTLSLDGNIIDTRVSSLNITTPTTPILFGIHATSAKILYLGTVRITSFRKWRSGELVQSLVACRRNSDGVLGMYDTVSGQFFTNAGTGTFKAGPEVGRF